MPRFAVHRGLLPIGLTLLLLAAGGCDVPVARNGQQPVKPQSDKEGQTWKCADLVTYLNGKGIRLFTLGEPIVDTSAPEMLLLVDDPGALARKKSTAWLTAWNEKQAGTGTILIVRHRSADEAMQHLLPSADRGLIWGHFVVVVYGTYPGDATADRSIQLIQKIRETLVNSSLRIAAAVIPARRTSSLQLKEDGRITS